MWSAFVFCFVSGIILPGTDSVGGPKGHYSNEWIMKTTLAGIDVSSFAREFGFEIIAEVQ